MSIQECRISALLIGLICLFTLFASGCSREQLNLWRAEQIKAGMTFHQVYRIMGRPDVGFGLPQKGSKEQSWLYYKTPDNKYLIINFIGDRVADPPISIEDRNVLVPWLAMLLHILTSPCKADCASRSKFPIQNGFLFGPIHGAVNTKYQKAVVDEVALFDYPEDNVRRCS